MTPMSGVHGAANIAIALADSVEYQGRKAARHSSEQRRQRILDATMEIVAREGVRGVRHRAIAAQAQVSLSATTYYFKDIEDLLSDAFSQYVERSASYMAGLWARTEELLREMMSRGDSSLAARRQLADDIAHMTLEYVQRQLRHRRDALLVEQAFRQEALFNPRLAQLVSKHQCILLRGGSQMLHVLGSREPLQDAEVLTAIIGRMEYQGLLEGHGSEQAHESLGVLTRYMHRIMAND